MHRNDVKFSFVSWVISHRGAGPPVPGRRNKVLDASNYPRAVFGWTRRNRDDEDAHPSLRAVLLGPTRRAHPLRARPGLLRRLDATPVPDPPRGGVGARSPAV